MMNHRFNKLKQPINIIKKISNMRKTLIILFCISFFSCSRDFSKERKEQGYNYVIHYNCDTRYSRHDTNECMEIFCEEYELLKNGCVVAEGKTVCGSYEIEEL